MADIMKMEHEELKTHNESFKQYKDEMNDSFNKITESLEKMAKSADIAGGLSFFGNVTENIQSVMTRYSQVMDEMTSFIDNQISSQQQADEAGSKEASQIGEKFSDIASNFMPQG